MKKRRPCARNYSPSQKHFQKHTHERFPTKAKSTCDSKGRSVKRIHPKLQQDDHGSTLRLKKDAFGSLESLFDLKKLLNLRDVYPLAFDYYKEKSFRASTTVTKAEPLVETLFLQTFLPKTDLESHILKSIHEEYKRARIEQETKNEVRSRKKFQTKASNSTWESQQNELINNQQNHLTNMAENENQEEIAEPVEESELEVEEPESVEVVEVTETIEVPEAEEEKIDEVEEERVTVDLVEEEIEFVDVPEERKDEIEVEQIIDEEPPDYVILSDVVEEPTDTDLLVDLPPASAIIAQLRIMNETCVVLASEIQQLKCEVQEISEKPELTEEDTYIIQQKQDALMSKVAQLEQLTQKVQKTREEIGQIGALIGEIDVKEKEEPILERFELPQIEYPEDKLPRIIVCGSAENDIPQIVVADSERKDRDKCFENLTGKLTESLTMQEKLVKENAQLEGGKYKLEEALLEKDTALECLQRKVCGLQAEMRIIVRENTELSRQLATLNQLMTRPSTCCYTCPGATPSSPPTSPLLPPCLQVSTQLQDDIYCQCQHCLQSSQFIDSVSPTTGTVCNSPRLTGGGSRTDDRFFIDNKSLSQNTEMCCRAPTVVKANQLPRVACPGDLADKIVTCGTSTKQLEQQLGSMECEVRNMQLELANVQRERQQLEQQRKLLKCTGPCAPCTCCPPPPPATTCVTATQLKAAPPAQIAQPTAPICPGSCANAMGTSASAQQQLRDLREQYARLQEDYKNKLCEVSYMRTDAEKLKQDTRDAKEDKERMEIKLIDAQERLKVLETEKTKFEGHKEQLIEQEQALMVAKQRFRESQDELEELRSLIQDQATQLEDYRNKYLQAQQQVEEQRRQLDLMEMDNARMNENVTLEIGRVKNQFQEKLAELAPLPDILKQMQMKMQEAQQMRLVAERNCEDLSRELLGHKDKVQTLQNQLDMLRAEHQALEDERGIGSEKFEEMEKKCSELRHENERMKNTLARYEEHATQQQKRIDEKMHENTQLSSMLEQIREDSARQVARTKERSETTRRTMQGQIAEMERQLAQCRATARAAQRDRDEIRQKMQGQINNLNEAFKHAQGRIKSLQGHVNYLKTSYSNIFLGQGEAPTAALPANDSCDCNY